MSRYLYRAARFHVSNNHGRRRLWVRYQTAPGVAFSYALLAGFIPASALFAVAAGRQLFRGDTLHRILGGAVAVLRHLFTH